MKNGCLNHTIMQFSDSEWITILGGVMIHGGLEYERIQMLSCVCKTLENVYKAYLTQPEQLEYDAGGKVVRGVRIFGLLHGEYREATDATAKRAFYNFGQLITSTELTIVKTMRHWCLGKLTKPREGNAFGQMLTRGLQDNILKDRLIGDAFDNVDNMFCDEPTETFAEFYWGGELHTIMLNWHDSFSIVKGPWVNLTTSGTKFVRRSTSTPGWWDWDGWEGPLDDEVAIVLNALLN